MNTRERVLETMQELKISSSEVNQSIESCAGMERG